MVKPQHNERYRALTRSPVLYKVLITYKRKVVQRLVIILGVGLV